MSGSLKFVILLGLLGAYFGAVQGANVLCLFTSTSVSHNIIQMSYARGLLERGHNVTVVTSIPLQGKDKELPYNHILIPPAKEVKKRIDEILTAMAKPKSSMNAMTMAFRTINNFGPTQHALVKDQRFQDFMHNPDNKFDLLIMGYFINDFMLGFGVHFNCPVVLTWTQSPNLLTDYYIGNPPEVSYVPSSPMTGATDPLTFKGRLINFFSSLMTRFFGFLIQRPMSQFYKDLFPDPNFPSLEEAGKKVSLVLCSSHFSEGIVRPNVPAVIEVGGIQVKEKPDPLPEDLQQIFNSSKEHGVIFLSFGSNVQSSHMSPDTYNAIFKVLADLKQTVLWKWNSEETPGRAPNIHYRKWLPQDDLLAQSELKLFITHAGKGSIVESQYHGVPMVAIPIFGDQNANAVSMEKDGFGVQMPITLVTKEKLEAAIAEVLNNPKYRENIQRFSKLYRDRPLSAKQTALYWLEYVIRHKGAYHMQSPLVYLNFWQYNSVDVIGFLLLVIYIAYRVTKLSLKFAYRKIFKKSDAKKIKKQ